MTTRTVFITGGIGSGKSAVCTYLASEGIPVYDSDSRTRELYSSSETLLPAIETAFGRSFRTGEGTLDRGALASVIFSSREALERLESIVHPAVLEDFLSWRRQLEGKVPFVVMESAIVAEKPVFQGIADFVLMVDAPEELRIQRAVARDSASAEAIRERVRNQRPDPAKADAVVTNCGTLSELQQAVRTALAPMWK